MPSCRSTGWPRPGVWRSPGFGTSSMPTPRVVSSGSSVRSGSTWCSSIWPCSGSGDGSGTVVHRGVTLTDLDVAAVLARAPQVALVDELAHTNAPGGAHEKRWQDVQDLLLAGIDVITPVNVLH